MKNLLSLIFAILTIPSFAQELGSEKINLTFKEGVLFQHENDFLMRLRFRVQNRFVMETKDAEEFELRDTDFTVRRVRLRFDGFAYDPRLLYRLQFSFTRDDQDWDNAQVPNILRDAVVGWRWNPKHTLWVGVTKLPGNRQRTISSSAQQLVDRSTVNATFNIDRDAGVQHHSQFGDEKPMWLKLAVSNGEGRNQPNKNGSLATTARLEWYPLGKFHDDGDNFEADLYREPEPRLGLGVAHSANQLTNRTGGQTGDILPDGIFRSMEARFLDMVFKHRGYSLSAEWAKRTAPSPIVDADHFIYTGEGLNVQTGYLFENNWEPSLRWSALRPTEDIQTVAQEQHQYTAGLSKYIRNHIVKVQSDMTYQEFTGSNMAYSSNWIWRIQLEVGI
jgi:phosphate-selective porin OprO/OprP